MFYDNFIGMSPEIREKFQGVDMNKQRLLLSGSLYMVMLASQGNEAAGLYLHKIAKRHSKADLDIRPELYDLWLQAVMQTVRIIDTQCNADIERAWREVMLYGVEYLKNRYHEE